MAENVIIYSKPIKISQNLARLLHPSSEKSAQVSSSASKTILPDLPVASEQNFRDDGVYVADELFKELQKEEVVYEVTTRELKEVLQEQYKPLKGKQQLLTNLEAPLPLKQLHQCLTENAKLPLKCHQATKDFIDYVKDVTHP